MLVKAKPYEYSLDLGSAALLIIDMQRDFLEPGGFGEMLGNDVSQLRRTIEPNQALLAAWRAAGRPGDPHARGPSPRPCRPAAGEENPRPQRDDASATPVRWAASWCAARPATTSFPNSIPRAGEPVIDKPGKGAFFATDLHAILQNRGIQPARRDRRHHRGLRQHHGPRGQRPRLRLPRRLPTAAARTSPSSTRWA